MFCTPLHLATANGHLFVIELLIRYGADVNARNQNKETPLHLASYLGKPIIVCLLLASGSIVNLQDGEDSTPLRRAAESGHLEIVTLLLRSGAGVINKNPLDLALGNSRLDVARSLAEWIGGVEFQDRINLASLDTVSQDSVPSVTESSLVHGRDPNTPNEWRTSLHAASSAGHLELVQSLLEVGADVNKRNGDHSTPLFYASEGGRFEVAEFLIKYGADVNSLDWTGWTPLLAASRRGHSAVVHLLLDHGADVNAKTQDNWTALHLALFGYYPFDTVKALLEHGADVHVRNDEGQTPFQIASRRGEQKTMELLSEYGADGK